MSSRRILLAEDNATLYEIVIRSLTRANFDVVAVATGDDALFHIHFNEFDLLMTDIEMPGKTDGIKLAHLARKKWAALPIVFVSTSPAELERAADFRPPHACLAKPFRIREILTTICQLLDAGGSVSPH
jgi:two-component system, cell cycle response regulator CpdR